MGTIEGDLSVVGVANLLQVLSSNDIGGYLTVSEDGQRKVIEFSPNSLRLVSGTRRSTPLGEILIRARRITHDELDELLAEQRRVRRPLGEIVADRGLLTKSDIDSALREQAAEEICDLFTWERAKFRFVSGGDEPTPPDGSPLASVVLEANMMSILLEAARRVDELVRIQSVIPDARLVPARLELPTNQDDSSLDRNAVEDILPLADGERTVGQIVEESLYPRFTVLRTLYGLVERGVVKVRDNGRAEGPITVFQRPSTSADGPAPQGGVLLVSDLPTFRGALALLLRSAGLEVTEAEAWNEAAEAARRPGLKAIVLDASIDTDEGLALCARLRAGGSTPFIVLSSNASRKSVRNAITSGARYVLLKPIKESLLVERVLSLVEEGATANVGK